MEIYKGKRVFDQRWLFRLTKALLFKDRLNGFSGLGIIQVNPELPLIWESELLDMNGLTFTDKKLTLKKILILSGN